MAVGSSSVTRRGILVIMKEGFGRVVPAGQFVNEIVALRGRLLEVSAK